MKRNLTTSILGDAGTAEASVVPNLESLNTGSDSYVTSVSDTSEFNVFQQLKIYDNYWETLFARHIVNAANAGAAGALKQANIQGNTEGWCRADHMVLLVPVTFTYRSIYTYKNDTEDAANNDHVTHIANPETFFAVADQRFVNNPYIVFSEDTLGEHFTHAWMGVLDVFNRLRLLIGNNGQPIQKQIETEPIGLKYHASTMRSGSILDLAVSQWGLTNVSGFHQHPYSNADGIFKIGNFPTIPNFGGVLIADLNAWKDVLATRLTYDARSKENQNIILNSIEKRFDYKDTQARNFFQMVSDVDYISNFDTRTIEVPAAAAEQKWIKTTRKRYLTLPIQAIIPLFRGSKFLPPDFRFKFEFEVNDGAFIAKRSAEFDNQLIDAALAAGVASRSPWRARANIFCQADAGGIELQYPYHILRQPVQAAISSMWLQKPFLYNYESIQTTEIIPTDGTSYINFAVSISTQRPTILECFLFPLQSDANWTTTYAAVGNNTTIGTTHISNPIRIANTPHLNGRTPTVADLNTASNGPVTWNNFEVLFSGRTAYRFRNDLQVNHHSGLDTIQPYELFLNLFEEQSMRSTSTEYNASTFVEKNKQDMPILLNNKDSMRIMRLILQPGGWADRGVISSRQGATTMTLNINFNRSLSSSDRFVVIRTNPEQLVFDSDKNVTIIQWPAIKSNAGYLIPNITAAP